VVYDKCHKPQTRFLSETDGAIKRLISIIDKEKFFGTGNGPIPGNRMESLTKVGLYDFRMNQEVRVKR
jgi:hypothetical protein